MASSVDNSLEFLGYLSSSDSTASSQEVTDGFKKVFSQEALEERMLLIARTVPRIAIPIKEAISSHSGLPVELKKKIFMLNQEMPVLQESLYRMHVQHDILRVQEALVDRPISTEPKVFSEYTDPAISLKTADEKSDKFLFLDALQEQGVEEVAKNLQKTYKASQQAASVLMYPSLKTNEVARAFFTATPPIIDSSAPFLARGASGVVTQKKVLGADYAAKQLLFKDSKLLEQEYRNLIEFQHPHIIELALVDADNQTFYLELARNGSLKRHLCSDAPTPLSKGEFSKILYQTADAIAFIHDKGYVHRDIKAGNILLTETKDAKLSDLGTVIKVKDFKPEDTAGTVFYLPIEYLRGELAPEYAQTIDVWCFGLLIWQQLKQDRYLTPFVYPGTQDNPDRINGAYRSEMSFVSHVTANFHGFQKGELEAQLDPKKVESYDPDHVLVPLMQQCLAYNPADRPSMHSLADILKKRS